MKYFHRWALVPVVAALAAGCGDDAPSDAPTTEVRSSHARVTASPDAADLAAVLRANATFAIDLHRAVATEGRNVVVSPYSVSTALAMTWAGARAATETRMRGAMRLPALGSGRVHAAFNAIDRALTSQSTQPVTAESPRPARITLANALWAQRGYSFAAPFLDTLAEHYGAGVWLTDFASAPDPSRLGINRWVSERTNGRIPALLAKGVPMVEVRQGYGSLSGPSKLLEALALALEKKGTTIGKVGITGIFSGGTEFTPQWTRFAVEELLDGTYMTPTYGNTLMGLAASRPVVPADGYTIAYYAPQPRAVIEVVDFDDRDAVVPYGGTGRVRLTTLTKETFIPGFLERDEGERERPYVAYPWDGISGVRPFRELAATTTVGVY
jgi:hypothetical protein